MTGTVELDPDGTHLLIRFPYREDLVALVKDFPGRRWDPRNKTWRVPAVQIEKVYATFAIHLFEFAPEASSLLAGTFGSAEGAAEQTALPPAKAIDEIDAVTVSQLNARVRDGVRQQFPETFWVVGEVVDFDKGAQRQHHFFQLVEKAPDQPRALAAVETALFGRTAEWLLPKLAEGDAPLTLRDGIEIRALVRADFYPATGRFQVIVEDIDPNHTLGKLALTREQILRELLELGLAEQNRALPFPVPILRVGVLASPDSDGWNDFRRHLESSGAGFDVTLVPIKTQGLELRPSVLRGLDWFASRPEQFDVVCIIRGGGSRTDLAWFDDRDIAHAVARHPLKIIVGIGHQRDQSVLDAIAHSEKTPTATAALLVDCVRGAQEDMGERAVRLHDAVNDLLTRMRADFATRTQRLQRGALHHLDLRQRALTTRGRELQSACLLLLSRERSRLQAATTRATNGVDRRLEHARMRLEGHTERQRLLDPQHVLARGYALARTAEGRIQPSVAGIAAGDQLIVQFRDGRVVSRIEGIERESS